MKIAMGNKLYDILKTLALYILPGLASLYFGLAGIWGLPHPEQVVGTIMALATFLGALLGIAVSQYNKATKGQYVQASMNQYLKNSKPPYLVVLSSEVYDILYWVAQLFLPSLSTLYFAIASIWHLPYATQIIGSISLVDAFLGIFLGINTVQYNKHVLAYT